MERLTNWNIIMKTIKIFYRVCYIMKLTEVSAAYKVPWGSSIGRAAYIYIYNKYLPYHNM